MKYKLTIIKYEKNENYEAEMARFKEIQGNRNEYGYVGNNRNYDNAPALELATNSLEVILTDEEYKKVKEGVIKVFE